MAAPNAIEMALVNVGKAFFAAWMASRSHHTIWVTGDTRARDWIRQRIWPFRTQSHFVSVDYAVLSFPSTVPALVRWGAKQPRYLLSSTVAIQAMLRAEQPTALTLARFGAIFQTALYIERHKRRAAIAADVIVEPPFRVRRQEP